MSVGFEPVDWMTMCLELLRRLDRIADELQKIGDRLAETSTTDRKENQT